LMFIVYLFLDGIFYLHRLKRLYEKEHIDHSCNSSIYQW
jgi:hypothetical protein